MKSEIRAMLYGLFVCAIAFSLCVSSSGAEKMQTESQSVEAGSATSANVRLDVEVAGINLRGGASGLMDGTFACNVPELKPVVDYKVENGAGVLNITQQGKVNEKPGKFECKWDIKLKNDLPLSLDVKSGVGGFTADLKGLAVSSLKVNGSVGAIKLTRCSPQLTDLVLKSGVGEIDADLTGLSKNANAVLDAQTGAISIKLPSNVGVRVNVHNGVGHIKADGFMWKDGVFFNDAYGKSAVTLTISAHTDSGSIVLTQEKHR